MNAKITRNILASLLVGTSLAACSSAPKPIESLEAVRADYNAASADEIIVRHAPKELDAARDALARADRLWREKEDRAEIDSQTHLAAQKLEIARLVSETNESDRKLDGMELERRSVALDLREQELAKSRAEVEEARRQAAELQKQMDELQAKQTDRGMVLTLGDVLFATGDDTLQPGAMSDMDKIASFMAKYPERQAIIEGHTDDVGDETFNFNLSQDRAQSVKQALTMRGVQSGRLSTQGFGETSPIASNDHASGRQRNRRVEIIFPDEAVQVGELGE